MATKSCRTLSSLVIYLRVSRAHRGLLETYIKPLTPEIDASIVNFASTNVEDSQLLVGQGRIAASMSDDDIITLNIALSLVPA